MLPLVWKIITCKVPLSHVSWYVYGSRLHLFSNCTTADTIFSLGKFQESEPHPSLVEPLPVPPKLPLQQMFDITLIFILGGGLVDAKAKNAATNIKNPK